MTACLPCPMSVRCRGSQPVYGTKEMFMKRRSALSLTGVLLMTMFGVMPVASADDSKDTKALLEALGKSKHTLIDGVRQTAKGGAVPISANLELEDGKLSLSVYTAEKRLSVPAEKNVRHELSGSPDGDKWTPDDQ